MKLAHRLQHIGVATATAFIVLAAFTFVPVFVQVHAGEPKVYFITPADGGEVTSPVRIKFGLRGMGVAPAGIDVPATGHHHLLINVDKLPPMDRPIPADARHLHFGGGQTEAEIELPAGKHTLQLLLGNMIHVPHDPPVMSDKITIHVK